MSVLAKHSNRVRNVCVNNKLHEDVVKMYCFMPVTAVGYYSESNVEVSISKISCFGLYVCKI
jgi:hypothetical protein